VEQPTFRNFCAFPSVIFAQNLLHYGCPLMWALYVIETMRELIEKLSNIDALETWKNHVAGYPKSEVAIAYKEAQPLWVERMIANNQLLLHPEVIEQLRSQNWVPNDLQIRMIWASIIASDESRFSKKRMYRIKESILNRYGNDWWEDVYKRIKPAFAAKQRIKKMDAGSITTQFLSNTIMGRGMLHDEYLAALKMIPNI